MDKLSPEFDKLISDLTRAKMKAMTYESLLELISQRLDTTLRLLKDDQYGLVQADIRFIQERIADNLGTFKALESGKDEVKAN